MAEVAEPSGGGQGAEVKTQRPAERALAGSSRRGPLSVLKVSQLLLRAIAAHKGLTLAELKKELGNAGYEVRRKNARRSGETSKPEVKGTLLRVSGSEAAGYFRVWKIPKPKRKPGRPKLEEASRSPRRAPAGSRSTRKRRTHRKASKKARAGWRRSTKVNSKARRTRARAKESVRARMTVDEGRGRTSKEDTRAGSQEEKRSSVKQKRSSVKLKEEKKDTEKSVKRSIQKPTPVKTDRAAVGQGKAGTRASTKCEGPRSATGNP